MTTVRKKTTDAMLSIGANLALVAGIYHFVVRPARLLRQVDTFAPTGSRLIDSILPHYEFRGVATTKVRAAPERIFAVLKELSWADMPAADTFIDLRDRSASRNNDSTQLANRDQTRTQPIVEASRKSGRIVFAEAPGHELVIGAVVRAADLLNPQPVKLENARQFAFFVNPNYLKVAMSWAVVGGDAESGYELVMETRAHALSRAARRQFALRWWLMIKWGNDQLAQIVLNTVKRRAEQTV